MSGQSDRRCYIESQPYPNLTLRSIAEGNYSSLRFCCADDATLAAWAAALRVPGLPVSQDSVTVSADYGCVRIIIASWLATLTCMTRAIFVYTRCAPAPVTRLVV